MIAAVRTPAGTITYGELARRITALTFEPDSNIFHALLGEISQEEDAANRGMLSVVVIHQGGDMRPGPGFFKLAQELEKDTHDLEAFWQAEFARVRIAWTNETCAAGPTNLTMREMPNAANIFATSRIAQRLASGYYAFVVAHLVAVNPVSINSLPPARELGQDPVGELKRKDGSAHTLNLRFYLDQLREDFGLQEEVLRSWAKGALLALDNELSAYDYFDQAPVLEMVYHFRNAVAHGNRFNITKSGRKRLAQHPAHNRDAAVRSPLGTLYEITPSLSGPLLFDFMGPADVIDLLQSVELHLAKAARASTPN